MTGKLLFISIASLFFGRLRLWVRAAASKSVKTNDFKIGWWNGVSITTTVSVISEKGGRRLSAFDAVFDAVAGAFD